MKKKILVMTISLTLVMSFSACGSKIVKNDDPISKSEQSAGAELIKGKIFADQSSESSQSIESTETLESSDPAASSGEDTSLSDWYEGDDRKNVEDFINNIFSGQGMHFAITLEESDVLGYNYQYTNQIEVSDMIKEELAKGVESGSEAVRSDIQNYRKDYGVTLNGIRLIYLNADGSVIYQQDIEADDK